MFLNFPSEMSIKYMPLNFALAITSPSRLRTGALVTESECNG